jgi:hypothetical protein
MPYRYEVFLSYRRIHIVQVWLKPFLRHFADWLSEALVEQGYPLPPKRPVARICFDDKVVIAGDLWPETLRKAARDSRCAIAIITPTYFLSTVCQAELQTFQARGAGLVVPVCFHDCTERLKAPDFPVPFDLRRFTSTAPGTKNRALFYERIRDLAGQVARAVIAAPSYPEDGKFPETWMKWDLPEVGQPSPVTLRSL